ncbi:hypothetical protein CSC80_09810 [Maribacter sp. 6B07]|uniref:hypothetical protein n=1 Tax=Maribacter TaxID=252356 RepID=UPI000C07E61B|nr:MULTISPECIES: hypothetical protein [Maribacter]MBU2901400.1 hypothetical protein [Maribacter dokdonensis]MDP2527820.1 hypothetical protein [Maribacter dokdonensis]PHN93227.1 hypothetical protein CSC80_09810 [Maribacter sp. 6B07]
MKLKHKVLVFNFLAFAILFIVFRVVLFMTLTISSIYLSVIAAILASFLAPKFAVAKIESVEKIVMKWIFTKGFKVL